MVLSEISQESIESELLKLEKLEHIHRFQVGDVQFRFTTLCNLAMKSQRGKNLDCWKKWRIKQLEKFDELWARVPDHEFDPKWVAAHLWEISAERK